MSPHFNGRKNKRNNKPYYNTNTSIIVCPKLILQQYFFPHTFRIFVKYSNAKSSEKKNNLKLQTQTINLLRFQIITDIQSWKYLAETAITTHS